MAFRKIRETIDAFRPSRNVPAPPVFGYLCGIAWQHEIGHTDVTVYSSVQELKQKHPYTPQCGIVKVQLIFDGWLHEQNLDYEECRV